MIYLKTFKLGGVMYNEVFKSNVWNTKWSK